MKLNSGDTYSLGSYDNALAHDNTQALVYAYTSLLWV